MEYTYQKKVNITADHTDPFARLSLVGLLNYQQEMITEYTGTFKKDNISLRKDYGCAWVFTKCHAVIKNLPVWNDDIIMKSEMIMIKSAKCVVKTTFLKENEECAELYLEMCVISLDARRIVRLNSVDFPSDMEIKEENALFESPCENYPEEYESRRVVYSDLDFTKHTNNVSYARFVQDLLGIDFFEKQRILSFDVHYKNESRLDDELKLYYAKNEDYHYVCIKNNDVVSADFILKTASK